MIEWPEFLMPDQRIAFWTILVGGFSNSCCALLGCYLVLKRMSMLGDAISHAVLPGLAVAFWITQSTHPVPMFIGALAFGVITSALTQTVHKFGNVSEDASLGVVFTSLFALGVVLIQVVANAGNVHLDMDAVLEGQIDFTVLDTTQVMGVTFPTSLVTLSVMLVVTIGFISLLWKELKISTFDPQLATAIGFPALLLHYITVTMVAGVTVASFKVVGAILVVAMLIIPAVTAQLFCQRLISMMAVSLFVAINSAFFGYFAAEFVNSNTAGMMVVIAGLNYGIAISFAPRVGFVSRWIQKRSLQTRIAAEDILGTLYRNEEQTAASVIHSDDEPRIRSDNQSGPHRRAVNSLLMQNLVQVEPNGYLELTDSGREAAIALVRAHRLWERYLDEHFELPVDHLHEVAERVEHFLGPRLQEQLADRLDNSTEDPHGQVIPEKPSP